MWQIKNFQKILKQMFLIDPVQQLNRMWKIYEYIREWLLKALLKPF